MRFTTFIFDLDGVLTDTSEYHFRAWQSMGRSLGIEIDRAFEEQLKGVGRMDSLDRILAFGGKTGGFSEADKIALAAQKNSSYVEMIQSITPDDLFDGVEELLCRLKERNIKLAIGSASKNANTVLEKLAIKHHFDYVVDANKIENSKPAPDIFLDAAHKLNVLPQDCVGIEDSAAGVTAIKEAHMYAIGIGNPSVLHQADIVYTETKDIAIGEVLREK